MRATGIRVGAAVALDVEDVDLEAGEVLLRETKGNAPTRVILGRRIQEHLRRYFGDRSHGPLFQGHGGRRITARHTARRLGQWLAKAGIRMPASPHVLRHSFATSLYRRSGGDLLLVKEALRHRSITSTLVYARADEDRLRKALGA
jgi:site-specific recombinase XerC